MPMVPLAHMMNNNPMQIQMTPNMRKPDFPPDVKQHYNYASTR